MKNSVFDRSLASSLDTAILSIEHGGTNLQELGSLDMESASVLDFSVCTNPFGPAPPVHAALARTAIERYPDRNVSLLRAALAERWNLAPSCLLAGNGSSELIWLTALAFICSDDPVLVIGPTYGEYMRAVQIQKGRGFSLNARPEDAFTIATEQIEFKIHETRPRVVFLGNPNNPTGRVISALIVREWASKFPETLFAVDEAYQPFAAGLESLVGADRDNLIILRSMTKDYALAGLRIGYAASSARTIARLAQVQPPWSVNALAQAAALAALQDEEHLTQSLQQLRHATLDLVENLAKLGYSVLPSATHFFLMDVGNATEFRRRLLRKGILVRDGSSFGLPHLARLATRHPVDNERLIAVLREGSW